MIYLKKKMYAVTLSFLEKKYRIEAIDVGRILYDVGSTLKDYELIEADIGKIMYETEAEDGTVTRNFEPHKYS